MQTDVAVIVMYPFRICVGLPHIQTGDFRDFPKSLQKSIVIKVAQSVSC